MILSHRSFLGLILASVSMISLPAFANPDSDCRPEGSYGYLYNGTSQGQAGPLTLTETGAFTIDKRGAVSGEGILAFQFSNFAGHGPLWLLLREVQSNGAVTRDISQPCMGTLDFLGTATIIKTSNPALMPVGRILFANLPRSVEYTVSGLKNEILDLISTSPGTIASGTAHKRDKNK